ncbi:histidinol-phosphate transaminase [Pelagicoccus sp. SDUM812003]|uniref:histidinol-phosphate transaminase n=1 Tax=Pelagicoccus sp. SDUM812003 TaxID=3041267 RepID=UPI0028103F20|nr:histidinol-phosphate transaminase [Pelagicoccus sp. SDUM812003]MDQ8202776.1 histidinol-phosphate transaminase [Pelagicoccus sp. SDUM812003]
MPTAYSDLVKPELLSQPIYQPGKPIEDVARELGLDPNSIIKLASNENPLGASPKAIEAAKSALDDVELYPDGGCFELKRSLSETLGLEPEQFIVGNGSNEVLELLGHAFIGPGDEAVMGKGAFIVYKLVTLLFGGTPVEVPMSDFTHDLNAMASAVTERTKIVFLPSPDNPSGTANTAEDIRAFALGLPEHVLFVLDEAYAEYLENGPDLRDLIAAGRKIFCTRTFSKIYGLAGLRIGYGYGSAELVSLLNRAREPFNVNAIAQAAAIAALQDREFVGDCRAANEIGRLQLEAGFAKLGCSFIRSFANFVTVKVGDGMGCFQRLQEMGVIVRPLAPYGMPEWVRITIGLPEQNERALSALNSFLNS